MKKRLHAFIAAVIIILGIAPLTSFKDGDAGTSVKGQSTPGTVTFTVKTLPAGGNYAPRHVLAIWVEHNGTFVKTRKAMANQRKQYLYMWKASSNYNVVDAITGPTLTSHQTHTVTWDCTDLDGNVVLDSDYTMIIEFTDKHAQGPFYEIDFTKGTEPVVINPPDQTYIINMQLTYEPENIATADFSANVTEVCPEDQVTFTDNSTGATSWAWDFGEGAFPSTANTQGPHNVGYVSTGSKTVSLTINGDITQTLTDYITVYPTPVAGFTFGQNSFVVDFTNTSVNAVSYFWDFDDGETSTDENPTHVYGQDGTYEVSLTATSEMCGDAVHSETIIINTVGISEDEFSKALSIYPNPSNGEVFLSVAQELQNVTVRVFDLQGKVLFKHNLSHLEAGATKLSGLTELRSGIYFMEVQSDQVHFREKLLIK
jgi:PKD repeat protein